MTEPVSLEEVKSHLRLDLSDTSEDADLTRAITSARRSCELHIHRSAIGATEILVLDTFPRGGSYPWLLLPLEARNPRARDILLAGGAVASITSITYVDGEGMTQTLPPGQFVAELGDTPALAPVGCWPQTADQPGAVTITYVVSPLSADDLAVIARAALLLIGNWYQNREAAIVDTRGAPAELPLAVTWLLQPLIKWAAD